MELQALGDDPADDPEADALVANDAEQQPDDGCSLRRRVLASLARLPGSVNIVIGALAFAGSNVLAKVLYNRGMTEVTLFALRGASVYALNAGVVWASGGAPGPVLRLKDPAPALLLARGACGFALLMLLNVACVLRFGSPRHPPRCSESVVLSPLSFS